MEGNERSINPNQLASETQSNMPSSNQTEISNNQAKETPFLIPKMENQDSTRDSASNLKNSNEILATQLESNQKLQTNQTVISAGVLNQPFQNVDLNLVKKNQQRGTRNRNINHTSGPIYCQQPIINNNNNTNSINLRNNASNPNLMMMSAININGNNNSNPNSSFFQPSSNMINNTNITPNAPQIIPPTPTSVPKKDKNKEKKDKNIKKVIKDIKDKKEKNKMDSDEDWSKTTSRHNSSKRPSRRNTDQLHQQTSTNPLDVWVVSAPFFKPLPAVEEINKVCGDIETDILSRNLENNANNNDELKKGRHWSTWMKDIVVNTINASTHSNSAKNQKNAQHSDGDQPLSRSNSSSLKVIDYREYYCNSYCMEKKGLPKSLPQNHAGILYPPAPSPDLSDISSFWLENPQEFPITDLQMRNYSIIDNLLSAFVVAEPDKTHDAFIQEMMIEYESPFTLDNNNEGELAKCKKDDEEENSDVRKYENNLNEDKYFLPTNIPVPQIDYDDYLSHPFEERLEMELQSVGFIRPDQPINDNNSFTHEFEKYHKELDELQHKIDKTKQEVISNLPSYKLIEERRMNVLSNYNKEISKKKQHKK